MIQSILRESAWLMEPNALQRFMAHVHQNLTFKEESITPEMRALLGGGGDEDQKPYRTDGTLAIIEIRGTLVKRASGFFAWLLGVQGMEAIGQGFKHAVEDPNIKGIFLDIDSPGGSVDGTMDLAEIIYSARGKKPILTYADGTMASAAQWIGSAADHVVAANEMTSLGSIGIFGIHLDFADQAKAMGIRPTVFHAGKYKAIGNQLEHLSTSDKKYIQENVDYQHTQFINGISKNIGIPVDQLDSDLKEAKIFMGSQAVKVGLANAVMNRDQAMGKLKSMTAASKYKSIMVKNSVKREAIMKFKNSGLVQIIEAVKKCETVEELSKLESDLLIEIKHRENSGKNWVEKSEVQTLKKQTQSVVSEHRRVILSLPKFRKMQSEYALGQAIGRRGIIGE